MKMPHPRKKHTRANRESRPTAMLAGMAVLSLAAVAQGQSVVGWGSNTTNNTPLPAPANLTLVRSIECGAYHTAAILPDGTARFWGSNTSGQCNAPADLGLVRSVAAGYYQSICVKADGTVVQFGFDGFGDLIPPVGLSHASLCAAGLWHSAVVHENGTVTVWGASYTAAVRQTPAALSGVVRITSNSDTLAAVRSDGSFVLWGSSNFGITTPPPSLTSVRDIALGNSHALALTPEGTVQCWGSNAWGECTPPAGLSNVAAIGAGGFHSLALRTDGTVVAWGKNNFGQTAVPGTLQGVFDLGGGEAHSYAATRPSGIVAPTITLVSSTGAECGAANGTIDVTVDDATTFFWTGPNGFFSLNHDLTLLADGTYTATASGPGGSVTLTVAIAAGTDTQPPVVTSYTPSMSGAVGANCTTTIPDFTVPVVAEDNCTPPVQLQIVQSPAPGTVVGLGNHAVSITVTDGSENSVTVSATFSATGTLYPYFVDADGDGYGVTPAVSFCTATTPSGHATVAGDCAPTNSAIHPNRAEVCDGIDNNCAGGTDEGLTFTLYYLDADADGFGRAGSGAVSSCAPVAGHAINNLDCNDSAAAVNPTATEVCDATNADENCNGSSDDADASLDLATRLDFYRDADSDGFTTNAASKFCDMPTSGYEATAEGDCNDNDSTCFPSALETCANLGLDNDCDGVNTAAEATDSVAYFVDADQDGFGAGSATMSCTAIAGSVTNSSDCNDAAVMYGDADQDGFGFGAMIACNGVSSNTDCDDTNASRFPNAVEDCANLGTDNDCDGVNTAAEAVDSVAYFVDADQDGFGAGSATMSCTAIAGSVTNSTDCNDAAIMYGDADQDGFGFGAMVACNGVSSNTDCDDTNASRFPNAVEDCANLGADNDCDGVDTAAEAVDSIAYFVDADQDGFGAGSATMSCAAIAGSVTNSTDCNDAAVMYGDADQDGFGFGAMVACNGVSSNTDCDDTNASRFPNAVEDCANLGTDNDCDGVNTAAEAVDSVAYFVDADHDGFGAGSATMSCSAIAGSVTNSTDCNDAAVMYGDADQDGFGAGAMIACNGVASNTDCDDTRSAVHPGAAETCNGLDDDCAGGIDDTLTFLDYYTDADVDGFGASSAAAQNSCAPVAGKVTNNGDCDDTNASRFPNAVEDCANLGVDNDCDGVNTAAEATDSVAYFVDADHDGFGAGSATMSCSAIAGSVTNSSDCDDAAVMYGDADQDGFGAGAMIACNGVSSNTDCDDTNAARFPTAIENCANLGTDNDCDGVNTAAEAIDSVAYFVDADQDGFGAGSATMSCTAIAGSVTNSGDCNDSAVMYRDQDGDGFGAGAMIACNGVASNTDCNDADMRSFPGAIENCANLGTDNDCNGVNSEEEAVNRAIFYRDADNDGFTGSTTGLFCTAPADYRATNEGDCDDANAARFPTAIENCANLGTDNDCDGVNTAAEATDSVAYFVDADQDGFGAGSATMSCTAIAGSVTNSSDCNDAAVMYGDADQDGFGFGAMVACNGVSSNTDCDDTNASRFPNAVEDCANLGTDNDCDGVNTAAEATDSVAYFVDADQDGFGAGSATMSCTAIAGSVTNSSDCNDAAVMYGDADQDGFGAGPMIACNGVSSNTDCDDASHAVHPGALESCNGIDDDCAGGIDNNLSYLDYYTDADQDGFGASNAAAQNSCAPVAGKVTNNGDCDDTNAARFPNAVENCANLGTDNDCDGVNTAAEATDSVAYFVDADQDGFGAGSATMSCTTIAGSVTNSSDCNDAAVMYGDADQDGFGAGAMIACNGVSSNTDCDDTNAARFPNAVENCANLGTDNDCDGVNTAAEATDSVAYFVDADHDGFGAGSATMSCSAIAGSVTNGSDCNDAAVMYGDADQDGFGAGAMIACNGVSSNTDCDDTNAARFPSAIENCANLGTDNDCDGVNTAAEATDSVAYFVDADQDGFGAGSATMSCTAIAGSVTNSSDCNDAAVMYGDADQDGFGFGAMIACNGVSSNTDCDDTNAARFPTALENCANLGVDNDCDGVDTAAEAVDSVAYFVDADHDGFGAGSATMSCTAIAGSVTNSGDCDDSAVMYRDQDGDSFGFGAMIACNGVSSNTDCDDSNAARFPTAIENCANLGVDNDCDDVDTAAEAIDSTDYFPDADFDGFGDALSGAVKSCSALEGHVDNKLDCDDGVGTTYPGAPEQCNGVDDNCNGSSDDGVVFQDYYLDADHDGFGDRTDAGVSACTAVAGRVTNNSDCNDSTILYADIDGDGVGAGAPAACGAPVAGDCNDGDTAVFPGAIERCADLGVDNDCDGVNTEDEATDRATFYRDADGDGVTGAATALFCAAPAGYEAANENDCNDADPSVHPAAVELCSNLGTDNDCDGVNTEDEATNRATFFLDGDHDGSTGAASALFCAAPQWYEATNEGDCNDADASIHPSAPEYCSNVGVDNDCDGDAAESLNELPFYRDGDGDGFTGSETITACEPPAGYEATNEGDCNDANPTVFPGNPETCDGLDNDCAGGVDNGLAFSTYYRDADGDGAGDSAVTTSACSQPAGYVPVAGDGCPQDGAKTAPGVCGCGTADADSDSDGRIDCMDLEVVMTAHEPFIAHDRPYIVRVSALAITAVNQMTGMQLAARFDASRLELLDVVPVENGPFSLEVGRDINNASGSLRYALGVNPGDSGVVGSTALVDLVFAVRPEADLCRQDVQLAWLQNVGSWRTLFVTATSAGATPSLVSLPFTDLDTTDPVLAGVPTDVAIATDAGSTFGAFVAAPIVTATDNCTPDLVPILTITYPNGTVASSWPADGMFPIGRTSLEWTIADETGNAVAETRSIDIANHQLLDIEVSYEAFQAAGSTRALRVTTGATSQVVSLSSPAWPGPMTPSTGVVAGIQIPVAGRYDCITVKDALHSLTATDAGVITDTRYSSAFNLIQGDSNDDNKIDVYDFSQFVADRGIGVASNARSNFNADHRVDHGDFANITIHFFERGSVCTAFDGGAPTARVSVKELRRQGLGHLAVADMNADGWVDLRDMQLYLQGGTGAARPGAEAGYESSGW